MYDDQYIDTWVLNQEIYITAYDMYEKAIDYNHYVHV
jgi:hypothetical protein